VRTKTRTELAVLVPTVNRAELLAPLVANIGETTGSTHRIYLVMEVEDRASIDAAVGLDPIDVIGTFGSNATAVNAGYWASDEPFLAITNDDCVFHEGWDLTALGYMSDTTHIVGINQGDGRCTSFSMVRRSYIEEHSGVYDRPNTLYHGYVSQYPDTEFAEYAQHRGVWAEAHDSLIEHMHWVFGKADANHPNYVKARETLGVDQPVFERRRAAWS